MISDFNKLFNRISKGETMVFNLQTRIVNLEADLFQMKKDTLKLVENDDLRQRIDICETMISDFLKDEGWEPEMKKTQEIACVCQPGQELPMNSGDVVLSHSQVKILAENWDLVPDLLAIIGAGPAGIDIGTLAFRLNRLFLEREKAKAQKMIEALPPYLSDRAPPY